MTKTPALEAKPPVTELYRLQPNTLIQLKAKLPPPLVDNSTTEHKAGFLLGIQYVMSILEKDFTLK
jgi:hypothetical protein